MKKLLTSIATILILPLITAMPVFAASEDVTKVENFIKSIIQILTGVSGLVATIFIIMGGFNYVVSSGNPEKLHRAKHTLLYAVIGLAIVLGAFILSNLVVDIAVGAFGKQG